jgi:hypothetical protein
MQQLQFQDMIDDINTLKAKRKEWLMKTHYFKPDEIDLLLKITYELTDKDFEYLVSYILKNEGFTNINVQWWYEDGGTDVVAEKNWVKFLVQCKQWASPYISMKRAGEFYGTIYPLKKKNPNAVVAYVTTSYINDEVLDFFHVHGINGTISNWELLKSCRELGLFTEEWWEKMIQYIQQQRILKIRKELQRSLPLESELHRLQNQRVFELRKHLSPSKHKIFINSASIDYSIKFFQYWDLA